MESNNVEKTKSTTRKNSRAKSETKVTESAQSDRKIILKDIDPDQYVVVRNGFQGKLIYISRKTGELFEWDNFGDEQEIELRELKNAKNSNKGFFANNWFMFDEDWIVDYLGVRQFYRNAVRIEDFDSIFDKNPSEIAKTIKDLSEGQKKSVAYRARVLIEEGRIDSIKAITTLEDSLGVELIER